MCGINGVLSFTNCAFRVSERYLTRMRDVMSHRGPDGAGNFISPDRRLGLGHRQLAIIDLSERAAQPMGKVRELAALTAAKGRKRAAQATAKGQECAVGG